MDDRALTRLIRRSPALDASARRHWLAVLPHLTPDDRERLREILEETEGPRPLTPSTLRWSGGDERA